ncbi:MAG: 2Fe-2S iron-sulfur cluster binding domain-containing protein [Chloroflexi bacterium]|nr:2Fe-2S iron-sulfur cluster binding domain-containing protein [Chloroflexota bacterium]
MTEEYIQLTIDGTPVSVPKGTTLLDAAKDAGIDIPVLCYFAHTTANGLCRLCVVEVEGSRLLQASCVTQAQDGAVVHTRSPKVERARRTILEMLASTVDISESPELQDMVVEYESRPERFEGGKKRRPEIIDDNPVYIRDYSHCVMCWRCVQVCADDVQYTFALGFDGRGFNTQIATFFDHPLPGTTCVFCGNCVGVCPTGALKAKREHLLEQGVAPEKIFELTRLQGKGKRSRGGPHLDRQYQTTVKHG